MTAQTRSDTALDIFSTCPQSREHDAEDYLQHVIDVARWSEEAGLSGMLVYTDNGLVDPWLVSQTVIHATQRLCPLVAVQPLYMHPYAAAKMIATVAHLYRRRLYLNMVAGGFRGDLLALGDPSEHDDRYARLTEYTRIMQALLAGTQPVTIEGRYYTVRNLRLTPPLPVEFMPDVLMSGSSPAALAAIRDTGAIGIVYPQPVEQEADPLATVLCRGARFGIISRADSDAAWRIAHQRFPADPRGLATHKLAMAVSDSHWHRQLSVEAGRPEDSRSPYWLWPFQTYKTFCPYLVGSYDEVAAYLRHYLVRGYRTFILDIPRQPEDLEAARIVFDRAMAGRTVPPMPAEGVARPLV